jgi:putative tryptophan/tyrosine transport system substrate-binding protein
LRQLGWADGSNLRMEVRWGGDNVDQMRTLAKELVDLRPEVILADTTPATVALQPVTRTIPIVFVLVSDPVGDGFVESLSRPGGNITGFGNFEASIAGRWLELLTEIVPGLRRAAIMFNPDTAAGGGSYFLPSFEAAAQSLKVEPNAAPVRSDAEIESVISSLGRKPGSGLVVMPDSFMAVHCALIIMLAARDNVPAVYSSNVWSRDGGLLSYGADQADVYRRAAPYVDRILRGAKPAELAVQLPTKFLMVLNAKTAKALSLTIPETLLATADEVIQCRAGERSGVAADGAGAAGRARTADRRAQWGQRKRS